MTATGWRKDGARLRAALARAGRALGIAAVLGAATPAGAAVVPAAPSVDARAYLLRDHDSGRVLVESNADERVEPASLTKMMTVYVVLSEIRDGNVALDDQVRISEKAWRMDGSRMFVEVDTLVSVEDLLKGVIIQSGNDASVALAEHVAGDETAFAGLMNQHAARLGMSGTHFVNASGLPDPEHYTTARDMARLASALVRDFPDHYPWHAIREFTYNGIKQRNRNRLLWLDPSVDGIKTGHTASAGYCLVASARRDDMRLVAVVMGAPTEKARVRDARALLGYGFRFFETHRLYAAGQPVKKVRVWKGETERVGLGLANDLYVTVPRGRYRELEASMEIPTPLLAPVAGGARIGTVRVALGDEVLAERPLLALEPVAEGSLWQRISDHVRLMVR